MTIAKTIAPGAGYKFFDLSSPGEVATLAKNQGFFYWLGYLTYGRLACATCGVPLRWNPRNVRVLVAYGTPEFPGRACVCDACTGTYCSTAEAARMAMEYVVSASDDPAREVIAL